MSDPLSSVSKDAFHLAILVTPKSSRQVVDGVHEGRVRVRVHAPADKGAANEAVLETLAAALQTSKGDIQLLRGHTSKRKLVRVSRLSSTVARARLGLTLSLCLSSALLAGCEPVVREVPVRLEIPEESDLLATADNLSLVVSPDGTVAQYDVAGLDFAVGLEVENSDVIRTLAVYLAHGTELLAWGLSDPFISNAGTDTLAVFLGLPGRLATLQGLIAAPKADLLAAAALGRGVALVSPDGETALFESYTWTFQSASPLKSPPDPTLGALVPDISGGVVRLVWEQDPSAHRFDPGADLWLPLSFDPPLVAKPGAVMLRAPSKDRIYLFGGGGELDATAVGLLPDAGGALATAPLDDALLDRDRAGGTAAHVLGPSQSNDRVIVFGGATLGPTLWVWPGNLTAGADDRWVQAACVSPDPTRSSLVWCLGGLRADVPTADLMVLDLSDEAAPDLLEFPGTLPVPAEQVHAWTEDGAVYAQAEGRLWRLGVSPSELGPFEVTEIMPDALRARGGQFIRLESGVTFLAGGTTLDGDPVARWQVFTPEPLLSPNEP